MDKQRLEEIKARCDAATAGPWKREGFGTLCYVSKTHGDKGMMICTPRLSSVLGDILPLETEPTQKTVDANFIAHARTDIPALVDGVEELQTENERLRSELIEAHWDQVQRGGRLNGDVWSSQCLSDVAHAMHELVKYGCAEYVGEHSGRAVKIKALESSDV